MTRLLVSVKDEQEAAIALRAGVDIIDLKDPANGALGALDLALSAKIIHQTQRHNKLNIGVKHDYKPVLTSATVGEHHTQLSSLMASILDRVTISVDMIKIAVSTLEGLENWQQQFDAREIIAQTPRIKLIAVFFADTKIDLSLLETLSNMGFYGAMLDTSQKQNSLLDICSKQTLQMFTHLCQINALKSGLAGSLKPQHIASLGDIFPSYIGFRGGVCEAGARNNSLLEDKIVIVKKMLQEHNKFNDLARQSSSLALHV